MVGPGKCFFAPFERHPCVEIPADQHDSMLGAQHRRLDVREVVGRVDNAGELIGTRRAPAGLSGNQQSIVAHAEPLNEADGSAET